MVTLLSTRNAEWTSIGILLMVAMVNSKVQIDSSVRQCDRDTVCPKETVLLECFVDGQSLVWTLPHNNTLHYSQYNTTDALKTYGSISVWLVNSDSTGLLSRLVISYTEDLNSENIVCSSLNGSINATFPYLVAQGNISEVPTLINPVVIGQNQSSNTVQYQLEWSKPVIHDLGHYELNISAKGEGVQRVNVSAQHNKAIISTPNKGGEVSVAAVSKCGHRSLSSTKTFEAEPFTNGQAASKSFVTYIVAALAIVFCVISILLLIVVLMFVIQKLKVNKGEQSRGQSRQTEGYPLLAKKRNNEDSS